MVRVLSAARNVSEVRIVARVAVTPSGQTYEEIRPLRDVVSDTPHLVTLNNATLQSFKLMANGLGFDIHFTIALDQSDKLEALTAALQRVVTVEISRYSRRASRDMSRDTNREGYEGT